MSEFRDTIYDAVLEQIDRNGHFDRECADAVLAMPEMQAIRKALFEACAIYADNYGITDEDRMDVMDTGYNLPLDVCLWVLDEGSNP